MVENTDTNTDFYTNEYESTQNEKELLMPDINSGTVSLQHQSSQSNKKTRESVDLSRSSHLDSQKNKKDKS